ncbi:hypothetical protein BXZ70DRAFT_1005734 [Cristinia sonorae]|uniref:Uncharacterized protein n=1 Tax=Cristinia sonorae TaxID=1940300 RepID=A0A8K0UTQ8_9AGAR|nr:hypothetical protein BXZ70DRAFT_1005734 [Cristinia sonorae]
MPPKQYSYAITAHPRGQPVTPPSRVTGYLIIVASLIFFIVGSYATLFSAFMPLKGWNWALDLLTEDTHYKYFILFLVPTTAYFVIANWKPHPILQVANHT